MRSGPPDTPAPSGLPERLLTALAKVGQVLRSQAWPNLQQLRLSPTQAQILTVLGAGRSEEKRLADVAPALGVSLPTASDAIAALLRKKLVTRTRLAGDRRAMSLRLTAIGLRAAERAATWPEALVAAVSTLDAGEQRRVLGSLVRILRALEAADLIPVARMCPACGNFRPNAHPGSLHPHHCVLLDAAVGDADVRFDCASHVRIAAVAARPTTGAGAAGRGGPEP